ncbi:MAG: WbqC family protein, partial [Bacteroidia bacterium]
MTLFEHQKSILSTAYAPPIEYFHFLLNSESSLLEGNENYQKQSFRNRCHIKSSQGLQKLLIPVEHSESNQIRDIKISYREQWQRQHWRSLNTCYRKSPYFLYYDYLLLPFYEKEEKYLFDFNLKLLSKFCEMLLIPLPEITTSWQLEHDDRLDLRNLIHPKNTRLTRINKKNEQENYLHNTEKYISIFDLLFMEGPQSKQMI